MQNPATCPISLTQADTKQPRLQNAERRMSRVGVDPALLNWARERSGRNAEDLQRQCPKRWGDLN